MTWKMFSSFLQQIKPRKYQLARLYRGQNPTTQRVESYEYNVVLVNWQAPYANGLGAVFFQRSIL
jgi:hypothetical protein